MSAQITQSGGHPRLLADVPRDDLSPFAVISLAPWVGSDLSVMPGASAFGILSRLIRLNAFLPVDIFRNFGIRTRRADDLSTTMMFSEARQVALASALRLPGIPPEWNLTAWFPFRSPAALISGPWRFRYCPVCLLSGYHTLLHQLPWIHLCPWHRCTLRRNCPRCGKPAPVGANWEMDENLRCNCGHRLLDTEQALTLSVSAPVGAQPFIDEYLTWAAAERAKTTLIVPDVPSDPWAALGGIVQLPRAWGLRCCAETPERHETSLSLISGKGQGGLESLKRLETLGQDRPGFLQIPDRMRRAVSSVAAGLALKLPPKVLTDREMTLFLAGMGIAAPAGFEPARREFSGTVSMLPPAVIGEQQYLNLTCLHPSTYRPIVRLLDAVLDGRTVFDFHGQATPNEVGLLLRACQQLLSRGYAEGLRSVLSRYVPELYGMPRDHPHLSQPWVIAIRQNGCLVAIRILWQPMAHGNLTAADVLDREDGANLKREQSRGRGRPRKRT